MKKITIVINNKGEELVYASLKEELKVQGVKLTIKKVKELGYKIKYIYPWALA